MDKYKASLDLRGCYEWEIAEKILESRGVGNAGGFIHPDSGSLLPLDSLPNINKAYSVLDQAMKDGQRIAILGDVDVDGVASAAILYRYLLDYGIQADLFINRGKIHGLDRGEPYWDLLKDYHLLIIVDSLDSKIDEYKELKESGVEIIVLDHHHVNLDLPYEKYVTLVTSQTTYENKELSGAGVVWKFCKYVDEMNLEDYADRYLDLCACGLLADVMSMRSMENRYLVYQGLTHISNLALKKIVGNYEFNSTAVLFSIAPLVNAATRLNQSCLALALFVSDDKKKVESYIRVLNDCKSDQNTEVGRLAGTVEEQCQEQRDKNVMVVFIDTIYGVSGLLGSKICNEYNKPVLILKDAGKMYKGSMRSNKADLMSLINGSGYGRAEGHEQAAGVSIKKADLPLLCDYLEKHIGDLDGDVAAEADAKIDLGDLTFDLVDKIHDLDFVSGKDFRPVKFLIEGIKDYEVRTIKYGKHLLIRLNNYIDLVKWNFTGDFQRLEDGMMFDIPMTVIGTLGKSSFRGVEKIQVVCDEVALDMGG